MKCMHAKKAGIAYALARMRGIAVLNVRNDCDVVCVKRPMNIVYMTTSCVLLIARIDGTVCVVVISLSSASANAGMKSKWIQYVNRERRGPAREWISSLLKEVS